MCDHTEINRDNLYLSYGLIYQGIQIHWSKIVILQTIKYEEDRKMRFKSFLSNGDGNARKTDLR